MEFYRLSTGEQLLYPVTIILFSILGVLCFILTKNIGVIFCGCLLSYAAIVLTISMIISMNYAPKKIVIKDDEINFIMLYGKEKRIRISEINYINGKSLLRLISKFNIELRTINNDNIYISQDLSQLDLFFEQIVKHNPNCQIVNMNLKQ